MDAETAERAQALASSNLDWAYLVETASRHGVASLLHVNLKTVCPSAVPQAVLAQLTDLFRKQKARNAFLTGELLRLLALFESRGIPAIPYKGPLLASSVYGGLVFRQFSDLDLLIKRRHFPMARKLMQSQGYRPMFKLTPAQETVHLRRHQEFPFVSEATGTLVEIQWKIEAMYFSFGVGFDDLSAHLEPVSLWGREIVTIPLQDLLLLLCVHSAKHLCPRLGWICDVAELIRRHNQMDWEEIIKTARSLRGERFLFLGIRLANLLLGVPLPKEILEKAVSYPQIEAYCLYVRRQLFRDDSSLHRALQDILFHLSLSERLSDRIRYGLDLATTPTISDWQSIALPDRLSFLYYFVRPMRLAGRYAGSLINHFRGPVVHGSW